MSDAKMGFILNYQILLLTDAIFELTKQEGKFLELMIIFSSANHPSGYSYTTHRGIFAVSRLYSFHLLCTFFFIDQHLTTNIGLL